MLNMIIDYISTNHAIIDINNSSLINWTLLLIAWLVIAYFYQHQNKAFLKYLHGSNNRTPISDRLSKLAHGRAYEVLALFFILILTVIYFDTCLYKLRTTHRATLEKTTAQENEVNALKNTLAATKKELKTVQNRYAPSEITEKALDTIKQKYEELFINYYYLKRCNLITTKEFHLMSAALMHELTLLNASFTLRKNILTAARGTHDEMYATMECRVDITTPMQAKIHHYIDKVLEKLPDT